MKLSHLRKIIALCAAIAVMCAATCKASHAAEAEIQVYVSLPWLSSMARFIVGTTIKIRQALAWNQAGELRNASRPPKGAVVIALDPHDAARFGLSRGDAGNAAVKPVGSSVSEPAYAENFLRA